MLISTTSGLANRLLNLESYLSLRTISWMIFVLGFVYLSWDATTYPMVTADEALLHDPGLQLVRTGVFRSDVLSDNNGYDGFYFWQPPGLALSSALSYLLFGFGIWQTRLVSLLFGALGPVALFRVSHHFGGRIIVCALSAMLLLFLPGWVDTSKAARMDTPAITLMLFATGISISAIINKEISIKKKNLRLLSAGVLCSSSALFHPAVFPWALALTITLIFLRVKLRELCIFAAGASSLIGVWILIGVLTGGLDQFLEQIVGRTATSSVFSRVIAELTRYGHEMSEVPATILYGLAALLLACHARIGLNAEEKAITLLVSILVTLHALIAGKESGFYTLYPISCFLLLLALIASKIEWKRPAIHVPILMGLAMLALVNEFVMSTGPRVAAMVYQSRERDYVSQTLQVGSFVKPGQRVWGSANLWFAVVSAGGHLDASPSSVPLNWTTKPRPNRHQWIILTKDQDQTVAAGFLKTVDGGAVLPKVFGRKLSNYDYSYSIYKTKNLCEKPNSGENNSFR